MATIRNNCSVAVVDFDDDDDDDEEENLDSSDEALCEMLGLKSFDLPKEDSAIYAYKEENKNDDDNHDGIPSLPSQSQLNSIIEEYRRDSICIFPPELWISAARMRRLTDELIWGGDRVQADRTYETIHVLLQDGQTTTTRRTLTRLENFVSFHKGWQQLTNYVEILLSTLLKTEYVLYKEKLNLKPPGGSGFAPHLDTPSLRMAWLLSSSSNKTTTTRSPPSTDQLQQQQDSDNHNNNDDDKTDHGGGGGPQTFVTVMVAIDDMRADNGCLRVCKGAWSRTHHCPLVPPDVDGNPDAAGRAGAIAPDVVNELHFDDVSCRGGTIVAFDGWIPHRSAPNLSAFPRRAVFLTYNPKIEGDFHDRYYQRMTELRNGWRQRHQQRVHPTLLEACCGDFEIDQSERDALASLPRI